MSGTEQEHSEPKAFPRPTLGRVVMYALSAKDTGRYGARFHAAIVTGVADRDDGGMSETVDLLVLFNRAVPERRDDVPLVTGVAEPHQEAHWYWPARPAPHTRLAKEVAMQAVAEMDPKGQGGGAFEAAPQNSVLTDKELDEIASAVKTLVKLRFAAEIGPLVARMDSLRDRLDRRDA